MVKWSKYKVNSVIIYPFNIEDTYISIYMLGMSATFGYIH